MKKLIFFILLFLPSIVLAENITSNSTYKINTNLNTKIKDNNENTYVSLSHKDIITINSKDTINGLYILYELSSQEGTITIGNETIKIGENHFLHEYVDLSQKATQELKIQYNDDVKIAEIYTLSAGTLPEFVEVWDKPCTEADLLLFSTHSDDEQLFFLGLLPTYVARGASVQVVYFTNHNDNPKRLHEQLHGLYTVGIRNYPIMGKIPDAWSNSLKGAISNLKNAHLTEEDALHFEVENIRRFKPLVVVGHDEKGEYSHGQHILNTYILKQAIEKANDETYHVESYTKYGTWDTPKTYLHLYKENPIVMDYDTPLEYFGGKTAYEVSKEGYSKHNSQQWTWFTAWIKGKNNEYTKATDIKTYSPLEFGLYRSLVGMDENKNDMFENLTFKKDTIKEETIKDTIEEEATTDNEKQNRVSFIQKYKYYIIGCLSLIGIIVIILIWIKRKK